jgi:hypothetical protein
VAFGAVRVRYVVFFCVQLSSSISSSSSSLLSDKSSLSLAKSQEVWLITCIGASSVNMSSSSESSRSIGLVDADFVVVSGTYMFSVVNSGMALSFSSVYFVSSSLVLCLRQSSMQMIAGLDSVFSGALRVVSVFVFSTSGSDSLYAGAVTNQ